MLNAYSCEHGRIVSLGTEAGNQAIWFDLENPAPEERAYVTRLTGLSLPDKATLTEIEASSRLSSSGPVLTMSMPIVTRDADGTLHASVCGFVLSPEHLVTLRFSPSVVFSQFCAQPHNVTDIASAYIFVGLLEAIVDRQADTLEKLRDELDRLSHRIFRRRLKAGQRERDTEIELKAVLGILGRDYDTISFLRDSQLGVARIAPYAITSADWMPAPVRQRLKSVQKDISSLNEYSVHLTDKVQFLLDSTLGLINIVQNSLIKVLTIVSIVGIPPTLIAGIYGMNFHDIPELNWSYGYGYAWTLMILSAVLPLLWFRKKGWI
ncbi:MAG TPA: magnesium transporter CorA family protein [Acetobacteraceae bacterium]|nr:magnesium transporter CorA family protein [Acetobacteraceae bacterium]